MYNFDRIRQRRTTALPSLAIAHETSVSQLTNYREAQSAASRVLTRAIAINCSSCVRLRFPALQVAQLHLTQLHLAQLRGCEVGLFQIQ